MLWLDLELPRCIHIQFRCVYSIHTVLPTYHLSLVWFTWNSHAVLKMFQVTHNPSQSGAVLPGRHVCQATGTMAIHRDLYEAFHGANLRMLQRPQNPMSFMGEVLHCFNLGGWVVFDLSKELISGLVHTSIFMHLPLNLWKWKNRSHAEIDLWIWAEQEDLTLWWIDAKIWVAFPKTALSEKCCNATCISPSPFKVLLLFKTCNWHTQIYRTRSTGNFFRKWV